MLRRVLLFVGIAFMLLGALLLLMHQPDGFPPFVLGALLTLGTVFERWRYKAAKSAAAARGAATGERFIDPETGALMEVYYDAATGERSYVKVDLKG